MLALLAKALVTYARVCRNTYASLYLLPRSFSLLLSVAPVSPHCIGPIERSKQCVDASFCLVTYRPVRGGKDGARQEEQKERREEMSYDKREARGCLLDILNRVYAREKLIKRAGGEWEGGGVKSERIEGRYRA